MKKEHWSKEPLRRVNKYGIAGILIALILIVVQSTILIKNANDFIIVVAYNGTVPDESMELFETALEDALQEKHPDEKVRVKVDWMLFDPVSDPDSYNKLMTLLAQDDHSMYILSDQYQTVAGPEGENRFAGLSSMLCSKGWFDPLNQFGFEPDPEFGNRVQVNNTELFMKIGLSETNMYASIADWSQTSKKGERDITYAISVIKHLLS